MRDEERLPGGGGRGYGVVGEIQRDEMGLS